MGEKSTREELEQKVRELEQAQSELRRIEETLHLSEEKYSKLFQRSNDAIFIHDLEGRTIDVNQRALELFGYTKAEMRGIRVPMLHPAEAIDKSRWTFEMIIRDGFVKFEIDFMKKNGEVFSAEVSSSLFEAGGKKMIQGIVRDITARRLAEDALKASEEKYKLLAEYSADVIYKIDLATERYNYISPTIERILGYTPEEALSLGAQETVTEESYKKQRDALIEDLTAKSTAPRILELEAIHKDGHIVPVEIHANFIRDEQGSPVEILGVVRDISKQKRMREEREKLIQELQEALKEIKHLRGILSICSICKSIRDDKGYWEQVDVYIQKHSQADISHSICPECAKDLYPNFDTGE